MTGGVSGGREKQARGVCAVRSIQKAAASSTSSSVNASLSSVVLLGRLAQTVADCGQVDVVDVVARAFCG